MDDCGQDCLRCERVRPQVRSDGCVDGPCEGLCFGCEKPWDCETDHWAPAMECLPGESMPAFIPFSPVCIEQETPGEQVVSDGQGHRCTDETHVAKLLEPVLECSWMFSEYGHGIPRPRTSS